MAEIKHPRKWSSSMNWWVEYPPGPVKNIPKEQLEAEGFQSTYVKYFNAIMNAGWKRESGKWVSPCGHYRFDTIDKAYELCKKSDDC
jgi:hypothetical protein